MFPSFNRTTILHTNYTKYPGASTKIHYFLIGIIDFHLIKLSDANTRAVKIKNKVNLKIKTLYF